MSFLKRRSRGSFQPTCSERRIPAYYLGKHPAKGKIGLTVIQGPVSALYNQFKETVGKRILLEVRNEGLWVKRTGEGAGTGGRLSRRHTVERGTNLDNRSSDCFIISTGDISFGAVDTTLRKVFAIIVRNSDPNKDFQWECHAFLCNAHADAKQLTLNLVSSFQKLAQTREVGIGSPPSSSSNPNTMHVFTESLSPKHRRGISTDGNVTTLKITFNVEQIDTGRNDHQSQYNKNKYISHILSGKELRDKFGGVGTKPVGKDDGQSRTPPSGSSDKENEGSDSDILDEPLVQPRTSLVAVNTGLTELMAVQEDGSDEDTHMGTSPSPETQPSAAVDEPVVQETSPKVPARTKPKPRKKKTVRFTADINYIE